MPVKVHAEYRIAIEHHNPMETHASTVVYEQDCESASNAATEPTAIKCMTLLQIHGAGGVMISADRDPANFHLMLLNQSFALPSRGVNLRCRFTLNPIQSIART